MREPVKEPDSGQREEFVRAALEDMARSLHASYLQRWGRHDPAGLERVAGRPPEGERTHPAA